MRTPADVVAVAVELVTEWQAPAAGSRPGAPPEGD